MSPRAVLILGNHEHEGLPKMLSGVGFEPQVWGSMQHSLEKLRHGKYAAVVIDRKHTHADVLEFVLNVRDIDDAVPVVVIGSAGDEKTDEKILGQKRTTIVGELEGGAGFANSLNDVLGELVDTEE